MPSPLLFALCVVPLTPATAATPGGVLVATGTVTGTSGQAIPGASVWLYAWPSDQVLGQLSPGQQVPWKLLATATASSAGAYSLYVPSASLTAAAVSGSTANVEVIANGRPWFFVVNTAQPVPVTADIAGVPSTGAAGATSPTLCHEFYQHQLNRDWASIAGIYIWRLSSGATGDFTYSQSQSSTLGVGFSVTGNNNTFSSDGTNSDTATATVGYPEATAGTFEELQTQWRTALYQENDCGGYIVSHQARENSWVGGQNFYYETSAPATKSAYCESFFPGIHSFFRTTTEQNKTWTGSLGLAMLDIGFNATSVTGYSTNGELDYQFTHATAENWVCGTDSYAAQAARTVVQSHT